jgi:hypothetical protein
MTEETTVLPVEQLLPCPCCASTNLVTPPAHWPDGCGYCRACGLRAAMQPR